MPSLSSFGIQRGFPEVAPGYDPEEVDRHLELVAAWFAGDRLGEAVRQTEERAERILIDARAEAAAIVAAARRQAARELAREREQINQTVTREREQITQDLAALEREVAERAQVRLAEADAELAAYEERRRREADRLVAEPRRRRFGLRRED